MKKFLKIVSPFLCFIIPFVAYLLCDGKSLIIPCLFGTTYCGFCAYIYENKFISGLFFIVYLLFPVGMLIFPLYYSFLLFGWWFLILPALLLFIYLLIILMKNLIHRGRIFKGIIILRKMMVMSMIITCALFVIPGLYSVIDTEKYSKHHYSFDENLIGLLGSAAWVLVFGIQIYKDTKRVYVFSNYYKPYYILFLRRFIKDDSSNVRKCLDVLAHNTYGYNIMKIGNPETLFFHSKLYDTVYLSSTNWQIHLRKYIECSKLVFSIIDTSEGVIWEMVENTDQLEKYIYCILDWKNVDDIKMKLNQCASLDGVLNYKFQYFLSFLIDQGATEMTVFTFEDNKVVYTGNINVMLDYKLTSKRTHELMMLNV